MTFIKNLWNKMLIKERKIIILFDDMIADMLNKKKLNPMVNEIFIRGRELNISLELITQSYLGVALIDSTHYFIKKIPSKQ